MASMPSETMAELTSRVSCFIAAKNPEELAKKLSVDQVLVDAALEDGRLKPIKDGYLTRNATEHEIAAAEAKAKKSAATSALNGNKQLAGARA